MEDFINELAPKKYVAAINKDEQQQLRYKTIPLCNTIKKKVNDKTNKRKVITAKERKRLKLLELKESEKIYVLYAPLHDLWLDYMGNLMEGCDDEKEMERRISKADLHGSVIKVVKSKCPSLVHLEGIILIETKNMFNIITIKNEVKKVPKFNSTFLFSFNNTQILLNGDNFRFKASERTVRNFKTKPLIEIKTLENSDK